MAKVKSFLIDGHVCRFWSRDHDPPHFHVVPDDREWEIKIFIGETISKEELVMEKLGKKGPRRQVKRELLEQVLLHQSALLEQWFSIRCGEGMKP